MNGEKKGFQGSLSGVSLQDIIQFFCISSTTLRLKVESGPMEGFICISNGQIVHAQTQKSEGENAFYEILSWPEGEFKPLPLDMEWIGKVSINKPWEQLILESARIKDERVEVASSALAPGENKVIIYCRGCDRKFAVPADKMPVGKTVRVRCPLCKATIDIQRDEDIKDAFEIEIERWKREESIISEVFMDGREGVLICTTDPEVERKLLMIFPEGDYHVQVARTGREGFKFLRENIYHTVVIDERLGSDTGQHQEYNLLIYYIQKLPMNIRRNFYVCLLSNTIRTRDQWMAFRLGVDLIINKNTMDILPDLLHYTITHKKKFYAPFMEELQILRVV